MHLTSGYESRSARIEIVPLIDVVFLLLVFFIYAMLSMTVYRGLRVSLPQGVGQTEDLETLVIAIANDNTLWIDQTPVTVEEAVARAQARVTDTPLPVLISGDRQAGLGVSIELLSALRQGGIESVSFQVKVDP
ncbi:MAG: biopolymer transporter ExbD [Verrucomicrobia bacterium]|mgnify:CR=1 FL=1|jgi:biopolymer transport protein ExbD|nr:biopolymer transporter ExbD [Verrucomicrobiota bacterium]MBT7065540.1 biopolymer transporter ExbD [Verrucomicrobiota bacterium]MBT7700742.1 biopolymer transporter ExbD [Verrucomicrobiota bacterium]